MNVVRDSAPTANKRLIIADVQAIFPHSKYYTVAPKFKHPIKECYLTCYTKP
jgi:hypothetical protein